MAPGDAYCNIGFDLGRFNCPVGFVQIKLCLTKQDDFRQQGEAKGGIATPL